MKSKRDKKGRFSVLYKITKANEKKCSYCKKLLPVNKFPFLNKSNPNSVHPIGLRSARCTDCFNIYRRTKWRKLKKNKIKEKRYREENKETIYKTKKKYKQKNREKLNLQQRERAKIRRKTDPFFKIRSNLSRRVRGALNNHLKNKKIKKTSNTLILLGCSIKKLKSHLEKNFKRGMNWKNYGKWEIDHIIPCAKFDLEILRRTKEMF